MQHAAMEEAMVVAQAMLVDMADSMGEGTDYWKGKKKMIIT